MDQWIDSDNIDRYYRSRGPPIVSILRKKIFSLLSIVSIIDNKILLKPMAVDPSFTFNQKYRSISRNSQEIMYCIHKHLQYIHLHIHTYTYTYTYEYTYKFMYTYAYTYTPIPIPIPVLSCTVVYLYIFEYKYVFILGVESMDW